MFNLTTNDEEISMTQRERDTLRLFHDLERGKRKKRDVAVMLGISSRHLRRKYQRYLEKRDKSLVDHRRINSGRKGKVQIKRDFLSWYDNLLEGGKYDPHHAADMFHQETKVLIAGETSRRWLMESGHWKGKPKKVAKRHPMRQRRPRRGELVQIDGTPHVWVGDWVWNLLLFIDDATSEILYARFVHQETTLDYMSCAFECFKLHGIPAAIYSDRHSVFFVSNSTRKDAPALTQFGKSLQKLCVVHIPSYTPQARGRVERCNRTAQSRLLKELANKIRDCGKDEQEAMRLANEYLHQVWIPDYNKRFAVKPAQPADAHIPCHLSDEELSLILSTETRRCVDKNGMFSFKGYRYAIKDLNGVGQWRIKSQGVSIHELPNGETCVLAGGRCLSVHQYGKSNEYEPMEPISSKEINDIVAKAAHPKKRKERYIPPRTHPWKRGFSSSKAGLRISGV